MPTPKPDENKKPKPTKPLSDFDSAFNGFGDFSSSSDDKNLPTEIPKEEPKSKSAPKGMSGIRKTNKPIAPIDMGDEADQHINNLIHNTGMVGMADPELPSNELSVDVNTANLPSVASNSLRVAGNLNPEFHQVSSLPGNMLKAINTLGKALFGAFTTTPTKDIFVVANLGGKGPNTTGEVNAVANAVNTQGEEISGDGSVDFSAVMPGYEAQIKEYDLDGVRYLLVKDFAGQYIYAWPSQDSIKKSGTAAIGNGPTQYALESVLLELGIR